MVEQYALTRPITMRPLGLGSRANAKTRLSTPRGDFMLKRRAPHRSGEEFVKFVHALHRHLEARAVQVAPLMLTRKGESAVVLDGMVYELHAWVPGTRWGRTVAEAEDAGLGFGRMLRKAKGFAPPGKPLTVSYHAHPVLEMALKRAIESACKADADTDRAQMTELCKRLDERAVNASKRAAGIRALPQGAVHGDLHPGNVLFESGRLRAVLDFDGARIDWRACELASAALHFGNDPVSGVPIDQWDPGLDLDRVRAVIAGAERGLGEALEPVERAALPWLMIEACTLESAVPIARAGRFAHLRADELLGFVDRKAAWIA
ncbi:MAG: phosphotransferase, partial [Phycisphaerae bacterium]|nr:phosphotransferase [Phycisphaerae bacterium]